MASNGSVNGKSQSRFSKIPGISTASNVVSGTVGVATGAVTGTVGLVGNAAEKAVDVATFGQLKAERTPPPPDPLWEMHREREITNEVPDPKPAKKVKPAIGSWIGDIADEYIDEDLRDRVTFLEYYLKDKFYGDWYHNAAVIFITSFVSWLIARLGGGILWIVIVMAFASTYYRTSILRVRRRVRDDVAREGALVKLETDAETMEWLNSFLVKFWAIYLPTLNQTVIETTNQVLSGVKTPPPIDGLELKRFTLGTKPPRIDLVRTYPKTEEDVIVMDWGFSFIPNDTEDLTSRQLKNKINPLVELQVRVGKGIFSAGMPVLVQDMAFKGLIQVKLKLITSFPHVQTVGVSFRSPPYFDFVLKPIGGETFGVDINFLPGLESFIKSMVHGTLGPMFYEPNMFSLNLQQMLAGAPADAAVGVLALTIYNGRRLKGSDMIGNTVDPYVKIAFNAGEEVSRTSTKRDTTTPKWNETKLILVTSLTDALTMEVLDFNDVRKDRSLGTVTFPLEVLEQDPEQENIIGKVINNGKERGEIVFDARFFPVLTGKTLEDGTVEPPPQLNTGIVRFTLHQAKDLELAAKKGFASAGLNPFAIYAVDGKEVHSTRILKRTNTPIWDEAHELLVTNKQRTTLSFTIKDGRDISGTSTIATYKATLDDIIAQNAKGNDWFKLSPGGRARITAQFKPVAVKGVSGTGGYVPPIGVFRFHFQKAVDLRNLETVGKVDPYVRVMVNSYQKARTITIHGDLNPEWDEIVYATVTGPNEKIELDVMDSESDGKDRSLGKIFLNADSFIKKNEMGEFVEFMDQTVRSGQLVMPGRSPKGMLYYSVSFFPCLNVMDPDEIEEEEKTKAEAAAAPDKEKVAEAVNGDKPDAAAAAQPVDAEGKEVAPPRLKLGPNELFKYDSGLLVCKIIEGDFARSDLFVQIFFDDFLYPNYVSGMAHHRVARFEEVGDALIRELEWSKMHIRLTTKERALRDDEDCVVASMTGSTLAHVKQGFNRPATINFTPKNPGENYKLTMSFRYVPVLMTLDPHEGHNNQGFLSVKILDGTNLPAADRRGKSDPYCLFELNGEKTYKTKVVKKTLNPAWGELFEVPVAKLASAKFVVKVFDWDMGPSEDDFLGAAAIDISQLEPLKTVTQIENLDGKSGQIRLELRFKPEYVMRTIQGTATLSSTFAVPGKVVTSVAGAPIKGVGMVAGGVGKGASFFKHGFKSRDKDKSSPDDTSSIQSGKNGR
ncbi:C2 domain-containing protein [Lipomyces tetrasporus]|uniref:C2 domain-containing protein n=1 Tax=Lipomyces tetrasporus TaxID=54092 RepID=A0AAD7QVI0_9ASCO|nr:C2 domain-containing protein [Lipomyces tetrasporus]KAJ8102090.1 C2 domain-containing protein [Lipomyces tetrasporus]